MLKNRQIIKLLRVIQNKTRSYKKLVLIKPVLTKNSTYKDRSYKKKCTYKTQQQLFSMQINYS